MLYGNLNHDTVLAFLNQICVLDQTNKGVYFSTEALLLVLVKLVWLVFKPLLRCALLPLKMVKFYYVCLVSCLCSAMHSV